MKRLFRVLAHIAFAAAIIFFGLFFFAGLSTGDPGMSAFGIVVDAVLVLLLIRRMKRKRRSATPAPAISEKQELRPASSSPEQVFSVKLDEDGGDFYKALAKEFNETPIGDAVCRIVLQNLSRLYGSDIARRIAPSAIQYAMGGARPASLEHELLELSPDLTKETANEMARTAIAVVQNALVQARAESSGLNFYKWDTCGDERVRASHRAMDGVICRWDDPPHPELLSGEPDAGGYHPGFAKECRCLSLVIIDLDDIRFPARVYKAGAIQTVYSLGEFKRLFNISAQEYTVKSTPCPEQTPIEHPTSKPAKSRPAKNKPAKSRRPHPYAIDYVTVAGQESRAKAGSAIARGAVGGMLLGPVGWLAGSSAKKKTTVTLIIHYQNGRTEVKTVLLDSGEFKRYARFMR